VNLAFLTEHCPTETDVKAVICHEFLHVLLRHTDRLAPISPAEHLAVDAVINAIIHRALGPDFSRMMARYYAGTRGARRLLRPPTALEQERIERVRCGGARVGPEERQLLATWDGLYRGRLVADDIRDLARDLGVQAAPLLLGNHDARRTGDPDVGDSDAYEQLRHALETALRAMNGSGIFRSPAARGIGAAAYTNIVRGAGGALGRWRRQMFEVLRRALLPDPRAWAREARSSSFILPVLSPGDRRAALQALWSPFLPDARWDAERRVRAGSAHVYLDVSGSMSAEMPLIVSLLAGLGRYIRRPFWAFSTVVAPARIEHGRLISDTTGGTSMGCVLDHIAQTRPAAAVVVSDGYIERLDAAQVASASGTRLHVIVTRDGSPAEFTRAGIACTQLSRLPHDSHE
jgi:hypothetical protein